MSRRLRWHGIAGFRMTVHVRSIGRCRMADVAHNGFEPVGFLPVALIGQSRRSWRVIAVRVARDVGLADPRGPRRWLLRGHLPDGVAGAAGAWLVLPVVPVRDDRDAPFVWAAFPFWRQRLMIQSMRKWYLRYLFLWNP